MSEQHFTKLFEKWWVDMAPKGSFKLNKRPDNKNILNAIHNVAELLQVDKDNLETLLKQFSIRKSKVDPENAAYYQNSYKYREERLTPIAPGRLIKVLFPSAPDKMVEAFTIFWKENIAFDPTDYVFSIGKTQQDYVDAFTKYRRGSYGSFYKSISDSCMRYEFSGLSIHPAAVYATEDFELLTVKDKKGKTRARCVVRIKMEDGSDCYHANSIYAADPHSAEIIKNHILSKTPYKTYWEDFNGHWNWTGARILKISANIERDNETYLCPYIDGNRYVLLHKDGEHLVLSYDTYKRDSKIEYPGNVNSTSGFVYIRGLAENIWKGF
jgi:hypothetical protein